MHSELDTLKRRLYVENQAQNFKPFMGTNADTSSEEMAREVNKYFVSVGGNATGRFSIRKINHRLHVLDGESVCYSPPDFIQIPNRMALKELADIFNAKDTRSIDDIIDFESKYRRTKNKQARKNP